MNRAYDLLRSGAWLTRERIRLVALAILGVSLVALVYLVVTAHGLVDAQGDAIFRRDGSSRLTYGNDAFFKLFGLNPARAIGYPFAPEPHPQSRAPLFGSFLDSGRNRAGFA